MKTIKKFVIYTLKSFKSYITGLFTTTYITEYTTPQCKRVIRVSRERMNEEVFAKEYVLEGIDLERMKLEKENLPRITEIIRKFEEEKSR